MPEGISGLSLGWGDFVASMMPGGVPRQIAGIKNPESCDSGVSVFGARDKIEPLATGCACTELYVEWGQGWAQLRARLRKKVLPDVPLMSAQV